eukprot:242063_1
MGCITSSTDVTAVPTASNSEIVNGKSADFQTQNKQQKSPKDDPRKQSQSAPSKGYKPPSKIEEEKEHSRSSVSLSWNLDGEVPDDRKLEFQLKISEKKSQIEEDAKALAVLKQTSFEAQVLRQKSKAFVGLYELFEHHATNETKDKMNMNGVTAALKEFGMMIDINKNLQKFVYSKFDIDREGAIDYNDFMATISSLIGTKDEETLLLMFQIFDCDEDGYLSTEDVARMLLAQNQMAVIVTGHASDTNTVTLSKKQCLKLALRILTKYDEKFNGSKISFDEFKAMMMHFTTDTMMIDNMSGLPSMEQLPTPPCD